MPIKKNILEIEWNGVSKCAKVFDNEGMEADLTAAFRRITGSTSFNPILIQNSIEGLIGDAVTKIDFSATSKEMKFGISAEVSRLLSKWV